MKRASINSFAFIAAVLFSVSATFAQNEVAQDTVDGITRRPARAVVFQAAGPNSASIQSTVDQFRTAIGGANNGNTPGPLAAGRREINWDGGGSTATSVVPTPFDGFLNGRGARFTTDGTGFVQAPASGLVELFNNAGYATIFSTFSPVRLFSPIDSNFTKSVFFVPGGLVPATTRAFGAVFTDVDTPDENRPGNRRSDDSVIEYLDRRGRVLFKGTVPASPGDGSLSFFGIIIEDPEIASVKITAGAVPGANDGRRADVVMMDDFIYAEPQPLY